MMRLGLMTLLASTTAAAVLIHVICRRVMLDRFIVSVVVLITSVHGRISVLVENRLLLRRHVMIVR